MGNATGIVEVYGLVAAFCACDAGCKAAEVTVEPFDKNKPANAESMPVPLIVAIKFRGTVTNVEAAVAAAAEEANRITGVVSTHILTSTEPDTEAMLKLNAFDKN